MADGTHTAAPQHGEALVIFGITGELAKVTTFRSLHRLDQREVLLDCPIIGVAVDGWTVPQLSERTRTSIIGTGKTLDEMVFDRLAGQLHYLTDSAMKGLAGAGLTASGRVVVEKPFGLDLASSSALAAELTSTLTSPSPP